MAEQLPGNWDVWEVLICPVMWIVSSAVMNQIKELEAVVTASGRDDIRFLGVSPPGMLPILVIGLLDCMGDPLGSSHWLGRLSWWAWLAGHGTSVRSAVVVCPRGVRMVYIRLTLAGSSSLDAAPVTGSLLFYAHVCCLAVCCAAEFSSWVSLGC